VKDENFLPRDMVLKWDKRREDIDKRRKFDNLWLEPYIIKALEEHISFSLTNIQGESIRIRINGQYLKHFMVYSTS